MSHDFSDPTPDHESGQDDATIPMGAQLASGGTFGRYTLRERIGTGGMGEVWKAEQTTPVRRTVAIKLIKAGMDSREVLARFEAERQALAMMDHPCIAKVYDAGSTPLGRPFFAMEYVPGVPVTEYCDTRKLDMRERLRLFQKICDAVQHAHQKAVLHRDLKPGNVLVADVDGEPLPKVIDFGVAKATSQKLTEQTIYTAIGRMVGTPLYMSPEQFELTGENVDTRTDVYSLGVVLYELLAGTLPFDPKRLQELGPDGFQRLVRDSDPPRPSTRLSTLGEESREIAARRGLSPKQLISQLDRELDWVVMKALEKDRNRRYESVSAFRSDIERYLHNEPVLAGPPSVRYRMEKFVARNRLAVTAASVVLLAVVLGIAGTTIGLVRALHAEKRATEEAAAATEVSNFLARLFKSTNPWEAQGSEVSAREVLDRASKRIEGEMRDQPLLEARLMATMGGAYEDLGLYDEAISLQEKALALRESQLDPSDLNVAASLADLSDALGRRDPWRSSDDFKRIMEYERRALQIRREHLPPTDPRIAESLESLANSTFYQSYYYGGRRRDALAQIEDYLTEALEIYRSNGKMGGATRTLGLLARAAILRGDPDAAQTILVGGIEEMKREGLQGLPVLDLTLTLSTVYRSRHDYAKAIAICEQVMAAGQRILGLKEPDDNALARYPLEMACVAAQRAGRLEAAIDYYERAAKVRERFYHAENSGSEGDLGLAILKARNGDKSESIQLFSQCCASLEFDEPLLERMVRSWRAHDDCPVGVPENLRALAWLLRKSGREEEARLVDSRVEAAEREVADHLGK